MYSSFNYLIILVDKELQQFWCNLLPSLIDKFALQAVESEKRETSQNRADSYRVEYTEHVNMLMQK